MRPLTGTAVADPGLRAELSTWPIQLRLAPPQAPFLGGAHLLLAAQCAGFALPRLHQDWLAGRVPLIACPKLDDNKVLLEKLTAILRVARAAELTVLRMSVPCCGGLERLARQALEGVRLFCNAALPCGATGVDIVQRVSPGPIVTAITPAFKAQACRSRFQKARDWVGMMVSPSAATPLFDGFWRRFAAVRSADFAERRAFGFVSVKALLCMTSGGNPGRAESPRGIFDILTNHSKMISFYYEKKCIS